MNVDVGLISKILQDKDFLVVKDRQIRPYYFDREYREQFKFIEKFFMQNGTVPTLRIFKRKFPDAELEEFEGEVGTEEPLEYWCSQVRDKITHNTLVDGVELCLENLDQGNVEEAIRLVKRTIVKIENEYTETSAIDVTTDAEDRKKRYEERKANEGMIGIPTGIDLLDYILKGFQDKQLITLIAQTGVGKCHELA